MNIPFGDILSVQFIHANSNDNLLDGVVEVSSKDSFDSSNVPTFNGINDIRMGAMNNSWLCKSCNQDKNRCPGHFGYLKLNYPVQSPMFTAHIFNWLRILCFECGELLIKIQSQMSIREIVKLVRVNSRNFSCEYCSAVHPNIVRDTSNPIAVFRTEVADFGGQKLVRILNADIAKIFERVSQNVLVQLGLPVESHPRNLLLTVLPIIPNTARPILRQPGVTRNSSVDTNSLIRAIVQANEKIPVALSGISQLTVDQIRDLDSLEISVYTMIRGSPTSNLLNVTHMNGQQIVSIAMRIPGKQGRIRGNIQGKRVHMVCRSVISGDPLLEIDEIGIPESIAKKIQIPVAVHKWNFDELQQYFFNKDKIYPGCTKIKRGNSTYSTLLMPATFKLQEGDIIYRDIINGDYVAFNRAPSLTPSAITCLRARIKKNSQTLSFNVSICKLFNADYDGDEMTGHFPLRPITQVEISKLMTVGEHMVSSQYGIPMVGAYQDTLIGGTLFTMFGQVFNKFRAMQLFASATTEVLSRLSFTQNSYTNYELISLFMPTINYKGRPKIYDQSLAAYIKYNKEDIQVVINSGKHVQGILDKKAVGEGQPGSIIHLIKNQYNSKRALEFIHTYQQVITKFLMHRGFTVGVKDTMINEEAFRNVSLKTNIILTESARITEQLNSGNIVPPIGVPIDRHYENLQLNALSIADDFISEIMQYINMYENGLYQLIACGSKGNVSNFLMINAAIGQQKVDGERAVQNFGYYRTLPYFHSFSTDPEARGFIPNSYFLGLKLAHFIFNAADARFSLIKNSLTTSITGAQNRTSVKNLESSIVNNLRMTTKANRIVQMIYGESGFDPRSMEIASVPTIMISDADFETYNLDPAEFAQLREDRAFFRNIMLRIEQNSGAETIIFGDQFKTPLNISNIIINVQTQLPDDFDRPGNKKLNKPEAINQVRRLCEDIVYCAFNVHCNLRKHPIPDYWKASMTFTKILIRSHLCLKNLIEKEITNYQLARIAEQILIKIAHSFMAYGSAVGILAAQALSEPMTQYILNSKHRSGSSEGTKTDSIVRTVEILGARPTHKMINPTMMIRVRPEFETNQAKVREIANYLEMMIVDRFVSGCYELFYENFRNPVHPKYQHESELIQKFLKDNPASFPPSDLTKWCVRFELDRREMIIKNMTLEDIVMAIQLKFPATYVVYSPETDLQIIVRIYMRPTFFKQHGQQEIMIDFMEKLSHTVIRGVPGIKNAFVPSASLCTFINEVTGEMSTKKIYTILTSGSNIYDVLLHPEIDIYNVHTDSVIDTAEVYGIEAAREKIITQLKAINSATAVLGPSHCHYTIYADEMTSTGVVTSIGRTGLSKREIENVLLKMSMASPVQTVTEAAFKGMTDNLDGVSPWLMIGQTPRFGSLYNGISINQNFIDECGEKPLDKILDGLEF